MKCPKFFHWLLSVTECYALRNASDATGQLIEVPKLMQLHLLQLQLLTSMLSTTTNTTTRFIAATTVTTTTLIIATKTNSCHV